MRSYIIFIIHIVQYHYLLIMIHAAFSHKYVSRVLLNLKMRNLESFFLMQLLWEELKSVSSINSLWASTRGRVQCQVIWMKYYKKYETWILSSAALSNANM